MIPGYERTRAYRAEHPERYEREKRRNAARQRALVLLSRRYPEDFRRLYHGELAASGLGSRTHGREATYQWGCRCDECRRAHAGYARERVRHYRGTCGSACLLCAHIDGDAR